MVKPEFTGKRDLTYNIWHRTLGRQYYMIDIDCIEWRSGKGIVAIIERSLYNPDAGYSQKEIINLKKFEMMIITELGQKLKVPTFLVFYNKELTQFDVYQIVNSEAQFWRTMNNEEYSNFLKSL